MISEVCRPRSDPNQQALEKLHKRNKCIEVSSSELHKGQVSSLLIPLLCTVAYLPC